MTNQDLALHKDNSSSKAIIVKPLVRQLFAGRNLMVATMHGKESVMDPLFKQTLGVNVVTATGLNTDCFGTFSGEIARMVSPLEAARRKCEAARALTGASLVVASEGSFGAHPVMGFLAANEELWLLKDYQHDLEIKARVLSTKTNFSGQSFSEWKDVVSFALKVGFPSHALMVRASNTDMENIHKGISDWMQLERSFQYFRSHHKSAYVETDMRAHLNPTRMTVIRQAALELLNALLKTCPACEKPGFEVKDKIRGLPCGLCASPTNSIKSYHHFCQHCGYGEEAELPDGKTYEDPMFCDVCNP